MMEFTNRNLFKIFIVCLLGHIIILPMFSLVLPAKIKKPRYQIVYLYQEPRSPVNDIITIRTTPDLPHISKIERQKIDISIKETGRLEKEVAIGIHKTPLLTVAKKENIELELPQPKMLTLNPQSSLNLQEEGQIQTQGKIIGEGFEIAGPGGTRSIISKVLPDYPSWAEQQGIEANVKIKIWVDKEGFVSTTDVIETSGYRRLDIIAEQAIKKWQFSKIEKDTEVWAIVTFKFRLK